MIGADVLPCCWWKYCMPAAYLHWQIRTGAVCRPLQTPDVQAKIAPRTAHITCLASMHAGMQHTCLPAFRCIASAHNVHLVLQKRVHSFKHSYFPCGQVCTVLLRSLNGALFWQSFNSSNVGRCRTVSGCACCPWHAKTRTWHEVAGQTL